MEFQHVMLDRRVMEYEWGYIPSGKHTKTIENGHRNS